MPEMKLIKEDFRGASYSILLPDGTEAVMIYSKKGVYRGGHSHDKPEVSLLLSGKAHYWKRFRDGSETEFDELPGELLYNHAGEVHLARFDKEGWLFDWKLGAKAGETVTTNDPYYRKRGEAQKRGR